MKRKIILTPYDKSLAGKYQNDDEEVFVLLDTTLGSFSVLLLDCTSGNKQEITFKNIGPNIATVVPQTGQYIDNGTLLPLLSWDTVTFWSDLIKRWIVVGKNSRIIPGPVYVGDYLNGNYSEIELDGTLIFRGDATVWKDENFSASSTGIGAAAPTLINWDTTSIKIPSFQHNLTRELNLLKEYDHAGLSGGPIVFHFHMIPTTATPTGTVKFFLEYYFKDDGNSAVTSTINTTHTFSGNSQWEEIRVNFAELQNSVFKSGTQVGARLYRDAGDPGTYSNPVAISTWGYHYKLDMGGSHDTVTK